MIYEIRMTVVHTFKDTNQHYNPRKFKTTLIEYIPANGVAEAFTKAAERKHKSIIEIAKGEVNLLDKEDWGSRSENISISLDAVVAKPELEEKTLTIVKIQPQRDCDRVCCVLNNGAKLMLTKKAFEHMLELLDKELNPDAIAKFWSKEKLRKLYNDIVTVQSKLKDSTAMNDHNMNWWLITIRKLINK